MSDKVDVAVIGAGVIGLAVARAIARAGREVILLEREGTFGTVTSSRNSEVIHAGIYYRPGGLRARFCHPGKIKLYEFCRSHGVGHLNCEKLIVAHDDVGVAKLKSIIQTARANGVEDLELIDGRAAAALEPGLSAYAAIRSPSTGIVDSHGLMLALLGDFEDAGGMFARAAPVEAGEDLGSALRIEVGGDAPMTLECSLVVNCAGLYADQVARAISGLDPAFIPVQRPAKGQYFVYAGKAPFSRLIYPLHMPDSQGVHYTRDLGGQARLGPDISWDAPLGDYEVDERRREQFASECRKFWPDLDANKLTPGYAGQRPKTTGPGEEGDFYIVGPSVQGSPAYIGLYGMESPGLTSCLEVADHVTAIIAGSGA
ncbi:MAG: FAD-dependent oxidoreductase [Alphaproteobacteria bacterium]|nr:FAD-dependent oxidoreductase [Alphaproteobacteria bacterium]